MWPWIDPSYEIDERKIFMAKKEDTIDGTAFLDSRDVKPFVTEPVGGGTDSEDRMVVVGPADFLLMREKDADWKAARDADRLIREAIDCDVAGELATALTTLLNRAYWFGQDRMSPVQALRRI
jgi:hypothetical protein